MGSNCCKGDAAGRPIRSSSSIYSRSRAGASLDNRFKSTENVGGIRLTVTAAQTNDSGFYTLQASNAAGNDSSSIRLEVSTDETPTGDDPPTFLRRLQDLTVKVGTRTRFLVEIISSTECKVTWYRNERRLLEAERVALVQDGNFWCADVATVNVDDAGRWTCTAENSGGRASCSAHLNVLVPKAYKRPEFVEELRALLTEQGTVSLECKVVGVPTPVLRWFKDSREIRAGDVFALTANADDPTSLGTYTCEAVNCMGRAYSSSKVHVISRGSREGSTQQNSGVALEPPPIFTKELTDHFVRICDPLNLSCQIVVPPWPRSVIWYNKEGKVENNERYHIIEDEIGSYMLEIPSAEWPDEGEWKCVATSAGGRVGITTCYVSMDVPKNYRKPRFMENLQAVLTEEGLVSFECKVVGFPTPVLSWFKDGQELKPGDVYQLTGTNSLGSYCCIARNCMGQASSSAELTVEDIQNQLNEEEKLELFAKNQAPKFIQGLKSVEAKIDESFRFSVKVSVPPEPSLLWYRDDQPVDESPRCHLAKEDKGVFFLDIQSLEFLDQAEWKCVALNDYGHSMTSCFLKLIIPRHYKKPRFLENLQAVLSEEGAVNLECKVIGVPQPVLKWYKDGEELKPGDIHRIISGQDGTCCLGTYTCEAQNCMGIAASSASLLGFDDSMRTKNKQAEELALQRNLSLSTIHEERTSQMYDTPLGDVTLDDRGEVSFSFDGKEVSVSLYETPDLTEEEALQIVEMYADQLSENITEHNVVELPPLRFVKETSTSGNLLMEAIIIDVSPEYFACAEEDLRTEADVDDISIIDENAAAQICSDLEIKNNDCIEKTITMLLDEKSDIPNKPSITKSDSVKSGDDYFSLSHDRSSSEEKKYGDTHISSESDLQSFESAHSSKPKSKPSIDEGFDITKTILNKEEIQGQPDESDYSFIKSKRRQRKNCSSRRSSSSSENSSDNYKGHLAKDAMTPQNLSLTDDNFSHLTINLSSILTNIIDNLQIIEKDIVLQSKLMSSAATATRSLEIINSLIKPFSEIQNVTIKVKESINNSDEINTTLIKCLPQPLRDLQHVLTIIEKCIVMETDSKTLVKKTCVAFIESCNMDINKIMANITALMSSNTKHEQTVNEINALVKDIVTVISMSADTIKTRNLLREASEIKTDENNCSNHLTDTQKAIFDLKLAVDSLLDIIENIEFIKGVNLNHMKKYILREMSVSVQDFQKALDQIEYLSVEESKSDLQKINTEFIEIVMEPILKLRTSLEQLYQETENVQNGDENSEFTSIKDSLTDLSHHIETTVGKIGEFDILKNENKFQILRKMAQILITLENNLYSLDIFPQIQRHMEIFHKNMTKVLESIVEANDEKKYLSFFRVCGLINRMNENFKSIHDNNLFALISVANTIKIIQDRFGTEYHQDIRENLLDIFIEIQQYLNNTHEIIIQDNFDHTEQISDPSYNLSKAEVILDGVEKAVADIKKIISLESVKPIKTELNPTLENILHTLEEFKHMVALTNSNQMLEQEGSVAEFIFTPALASLICELKQHIITLNDVIMENADIKNIDNELSFSYAKPLQELYETFITLHHDVVSQCMEDFVDDKLSNNLISVIQSIQSCIVLVQEQQALEGVDELTTLEDISVIKTTAEVISDVSIETKSIHNFAVLNERYLNQKSIFQNLHILYDILETMQNSAFVDVVNVLNRAPNFTEIKPLNPIIKKICFTLDELFYSHSADKANSSSINSLKLKSIVMLAKELYNNLPTTDLTNTEMKQKVTNISIEKINSAFQTIAEFKKHFNTINQHIFPALEIIENTLTMSNEIINILNISKKLNERLSYLENYEVHLKEVVTLNDATNNLLKTVKVSEDINAKQVKYSINILRNKLMTTEDEFLNFVPTASCLTAQDVELIQFISDIEYSITVLENNDFLDPYLYPSLVEVNENLEAINNLISSVDIFIYNITKLSQEQFHIVKNFCNILGRLLIFMKYLLQKPSSHIRTIRLILEFITLKNIRYSSEMKEVEFKLLNESTQEENLYFRDIDAFMSSIQNIIVNILHSYPEILFKIPLSKLLEKLKLIKEISKCKEIAELKHATEQIISYAERIKPELETAESHVISAIKLQPASSALDENIYYPEVQELKFLIEKYANLSSKEEFTLRKLINYIEKYEDYRVLSTPSRILIILQCLPEFLDILYNDILSSDENKQLVTLKEPYIESCLSRSMSKTLTILASLQDQISSIREQLLTCVHRDDVLNTNSIKVIIQAIHDVHQEISFIKTQLNSKQLVISTDDDLISLAKARRAIYFINYIIQSILNKQKTDDVNTILKSLDILQECLLDLQSFTVAGVQLEVEEGLHTELSQALKKYIEIVEIMENITEKNTLDGLLAAKNLACNMYGMILLRSGHDDSEIKNKSQDLFWIAEQLQKELPTMIIEVLEHSRENLVDLDSHTKHNFYFITTKLENYLTAVVDYKNPIKLQEIISKDTKAIDNNISEIASSAEENTEKSLTTPEVVAVFSENCSEKHTLVLDENVILTSIKHAEEIVPPPKSVEETDNGPDINVTNESQKDCVNRQSMIEQDQNSKISPDVLEKDVPGSGIVISPLDQDSIMIDSKYADKLCQETSFSLSEEKMFHLEDTETKSEQMNMMEKLDVAELIDDQNLKFINEAQLECTAINIISTIESIQINENNTTKSTEINNELDLSSKQKEVLDMEISANENEIQSLYDIVIPLQTEAEQKETLTQPEYKIDDTEVMSYPVLLSQDLYTDAVCGLNSFQEAQQDTVILNESNGRLCENTKGEMPANFNEEDLSKISQPSSLDIQLPKCKETPPSSIETTVANNLICDDNICSLSEETDNNKLRHENFNQLVNIVTDTTNTIVKGESDSTQTETSLSILDKKQVGIETVPDTMILTKSTTQQPKTQHDVHVIPSDGDFLTETTSESDDKFNVYECDVNKTTSHDDQNPTQTSIDNKMCYSREELLNSGHDFISDSVTVDSHLKKLDHTHFANINKGLDIEKENIKESNIDKVDMVNFDFVQIADKQIVEILDHAEELPTMTETNILSESLLLSIVNDTNMSEVQKSPMSEVHLGVVVGQFSDQIEGFTEIADSKWATTSSDPTEIVRLSHTQAVEFNAATMQTYENLNTDCCLGQKSEASDKMLGTIVAVDNNIFDPLCDNSSIANVAQEINASEISYSIIPGDNSNLNFDDNVKFIDTFKSEEGNTENSKHNLHNLKLQTGTDDFILIPTEIDSKKKDLTQVDTEEPVLQLKSQDLSLSSIVECVQDNIKETMENISNISSLAQHCTYDEICESDDVEIFSIKTAVTDHKIEYTINEAPNRLENGSSLKGNDALLKSHELKVCDTENMLIGNEPQDIVQTDFTGDILNDTEVVQNKELPREKQQDKEILDVSEKEITPSILFETVSIDKTIPKDEKIEKTSDSNNATENNDFNMMHPDQSFSEHSVNFKQMIVEDNPQFLSEQSEFQNADRNILFDIDNLDHTVTTEINPAESYIPFNQKQENECVANLSIQSVSGKDMAKIQKTLSIEKSTSHAMQHLENSSEDEIRRNSTDNELNVSNDKICSVEVSLLSSDDLVKEKICGDDSTDKFEINDVPLEELLSLLLEVNSKVDSLSYIDNTEQIESLKDILDEIQIVIIKLKSDCDRYKNNTLDDTLEDLECNVRSVQLQINEEGSRQLLKDSCSTLNSIVKSINDVDKAHYRNCTANKIESSDIFSECFIETEETIRLVDIASNININGSNDLVLITDMLNDVKNALKHLKIDFLGDGCLLIESGIEINEILNEVEDQVFSLEKRVEATIDLVPTTKDVIVTALHSVFESISNIRNTISSSQKKYLYENYGKPCKDILSAIKHLRITSSTDKSDADKLRKISFTLRKVLNHFEDIKFYIKFDKTARLPSDAAFTKVILSNFKESLLEAKLLSIELGPQVSAKLENLVDYLNISLFNLENCETLDVKEKISLFKSMAPLIWEMAYQIKTQLGNKINNSALNDSESAENINVQTTPIILNIAHDSEEENNRSETSNINVLDCNELKLPLPIHITEDDNKRDESESSAKNLDSYNFIGNELKEHEHVIKESDENETISDSKQAYTSHLDKNVEDTKEKKEIEIDVRKQDKYEKEDLCSFEKSTDILVESENKVMTEVDHTQIVLYTQQLTKINKDFKDVKNDNERDEAESLAADDIGNTAEITDDVNKDIDNILKTDITNTVDENETHYIEAFDTKNIHNALSIPLLEKNSSNDDSIKETFNDKEIVKSKQIIENSENPMNTVIQDTVNVINDPKKKETNATTKEETANEIENIMEKELIEDKMVQIKAQDIKNIIDKNEYDSTMLDIDHEKNINEVKELKLSAPETDADSCHGTKNNSDETIAEDIKCEIRINETDERENKSSLEPNHVDNIQNTSVIIMKTRDTEFEEPCLNTKKRMDTKLEEFGTQEGNREISSNISKDCIAVSETQSDLKKNYSSVNTINLKVDVAENFTIHENDDNNDKILNIDLEDKEVNKLLFGQIVTKQNTSAVHTNVNLTEDMQNKETFENKKEEHQEEMGKGCEIEDINNQSLLNISTEIIEIGVVNDNATKETSMIGVVETNENIGKDKKIHKNDIEINYFAEGTKEVLGKETNQIIMHDVTEISENPVAKIAVAGILGTNIEVSYPENIEQSDLENIEQSDPENIKNESDILRTDPVSTEESPLGRIVQADQKKPEDKETIIDATFKNYEVDALKVQNEIVGPHEIENFNFDANQAVTENDEILKFEGIKKENFVSHISIDITDNFIEAQKDLLQNDEKNEILCFEEGKHKNLLMDKKIIEKNIKLAEDCIKEGVNAEKDICDDKNAISENPPDFGIASGNKNTNNMILINKTEETQTHEKKDFDSSLILETTTIEEVANANDCKNIYEYDSEANSIEYVAKDSTGEDDKLRIDTVNSRTNIAQDNKFGKMMIEEPKAEKADNDKVPNKKSMENTTTPSTDASIMGQINIKTSYTGANVEIISHLSDQKEEEIKELNLDTNKKHDETTEIMDSNQKDASDSVKKDMPKTKENEAEETSNYSTNLSENFGITEIIDSGKTANLPITTESTDCQSEEIKGNIKLLEMIPCAPNHINSDELEYINKESCNYESLVTQGLISLECQDNLKEIPLTKQNSPEFCEYQNSDDALEEIMPFVKNFHAVATIDSLLLDSKVLLHAPIIPSMNHSAFSLEKNQSTRCATKNVASLDDAHQKQDEHYISSISEETKKYEPSQTVRDLVVEDPREENTTKDFIQEGTEKKIVAKENCENFPSEVNEDTYRQSKLYDHRNDVSVVNEDSQKQCELYDQEGTEKKFIAKENCENFPSEVNEDTYRQSKLYDHRNDVSVVNEASQKQCELYDPQEVKELKPDPSLVSSTMLINESIEEKQISTDSAKTDSTYELTNPHERLSSKTLTQKIIEEKDKSKSSLLEGEHNELEEPEIDSSIVECNTVPLRSQNSIQEDDVCGGKELKEIRKDNLKENELLSLRKQKGEDLQHSGNGEKEKKVVQITKLESKQETFDNEVEKLKKEKNLTNNSETNKPISQTCTQTENLQNKKASKKKKSDIKKPNENTKPKDSKLNINETDDQNLLLTCAQDTDRINNRTELDKLSEITQKEDVFYNLEQDIEQYKNGGKQKNILNDSNEYYPHIKKVEISDVAASEIIEQLCVSDHEEKETKVDNEGRTNRNPKSITEMITEPTFKVDGNEEQINEKESQNTILITEKKTEDKKLKREFSQEYCPHTDDGTDRIKENTLCGTKEKEKKLKHISTIESKTILQPILSAEKVVNNNENDTGNDEKEKRQPVSKAEKVDNVQQIVFNTEDLTLLKEHSLGSMKKEVQNKIETAPLHRKEKSDKNTCDDNKEICREWFDKKVTKENKPRDLSDWDNLTTTRVDCLDNERRNHCSEKKLSRKLKDRQNHLEENVTSHKSRTSENVHSDEYKGCFLEAQKVSVSNKDSLEYVGQSEYIKSTIDATIDKHNLKTDSISKTHKFSKESQSHLNSRKSEPTERRLDYRHNNSILKAFSEARSLYSEKKTISLTEIKRKPMFSTHLTDRTAVEGSRVKLTCSVISSTEITITWLRNGSRLNDKHKYRCKYIDGLITLEVLNAVPSDSAEYCCVVQNENGVISSSSTLKVYPSFEASPIPPTFTRSIRDSYHLVDNELVLECRIRGQPLPTITWLKDNIPIVSNDRYQAYYLADGVCRLVIRSPVSDDSAIYTCKAENSVWSDQISHVVSYTGNESRLSPNLTTLEKSRFSRQVLETRRPFFTNVLSDYKVARGGTIGLQVEVMGTPTRVEWLREGRSITDTYRNAKTFVEQRLYTLALPDVTENESGMYTCRAWSTHGIVDMNAAITVVQPNGIDGKPAVFVKRPEKDALISVGSDFNISFRVQGEPKPKIILMKGVRDITNSQRVCKMTSDDYVKFTLKRSIVSDAGTYCVLARNPYGCDRAFVTLVIRQRASSEHLISDWIYPMDDSALPLIERKIKAVPERIPGEPTVVDGGNNWISLAWPKPDPQVSAPILAFKVESWLHGKEGGARWIELGITPLNSFDVFNLKQGEQYHFRVTPRNRYGWGESVQTSTPISIGIPGDRPEFVEILPGQLKVLLGDTANLKCSVKGQPVPQILWMKNGQDIEGEETRTTMSFNGFNSCLTISDITIEDEGRYSCEASNIHGRASTYARLAVVTDKLIWEADAKLKRERSADIDGEYPPQFTMRLRDRRVQATYPVRLTCQVVGSPAPEVKWFKNDEEIVPDHRHALSQDEHFYTLEIAPTTLQDGGIYEVMARNASGAVSCRCNLVVDKGIRAYLAPEFCCGLEPLYKVQEGEELRISAVVEAYPSVGITWYRDGVRLRPSRRAVMTLDRDGQIELAVASVSVRDGGVYACTASNEVGSATTSGKVEVLDCEQSKPERTPSIVIVPDTPISKEPIFIRKPRSSEAYEGDSVVIECEVVGDPNPEVFWLRDFLKPDYYRDATHFKCVGGGPEYRLEIPHAKLDYTGAYSVVARNINGEAKAIISLQILAKDPNCSEEAHNVRYGRVEVIPQFERKLTDLLCYDGDAIEFECKVFGNPEPNIRWFHYKEAIREGLDFETTYEDGTARLKIKHVTAEDEGTYKCEAYNCLGKSSTSACLVVYPPGEPNTLSQQLRRPPALLSATSTPRSTPRSTPARSLSRTRTPGPETERRNSSSRQMAPKFYTYPYNKVVEEGENVIFKCAVKGLPAPWATWDKDGVILTPSSRITIKEKDDILRILEIEQVTIEDVGVYRITLENDFGTTEATARLEVITQKGKFYAGVRAYSASPRRSIPSRRRLLSSSQKD